MSFHRCTQRGFQFSSFEITKREILASITIVAVLLIIGFMISVKISVSQEDKNETYNKATKIENNEIFEYGLQTNIGNAFVYGDLEAVDTVDYVGEVDGEYMYIEKTKEKYTMHTRRVKRGKTYYTETYWTWDYVSSEEKTCKKLTFCGVEFDSKKIDIPESEYIDTVDGGYHIHYKYYGCKTKYTGTIFTSIKDNTINKTNFYNNKTIDETVEYLESGIGLVVFWIAWVILIFIVVFVFYYAKNEWLEG